MKNMVSTSTKKNQDVSMANRPHDLRSLWNYFFDFNDSNLEGLEPKIEVVENKKAVNVVAELPGIKEDDIDLTISEDGYLTISGEKRHTKENESDDHYFSEISYGMFKRTIPLPWDLDFQAADADYDDGVLTVSIPKSQNEKQKYKKISVKKKGFEPLVDKEKKPTN